jgi:hypothetical protein
MQQCRRRQGLLIPDCQRLPVNKQKQKNKKKKTKKDKYGFGWAVPVLYNPFIGGNIRIQTIMRERANCADEDATWQLPNLFAAGDVVRWAGVVSTRAAAGAREGQVSHLLVYEKPGDSRETLA